MLNVLIVDDDRQLATMLKGAITRWGHRATTAGSGMEALAILAKKKHPLILLDIFLPDTEGHQLIPAIKQLDSGTHIVTMTGVNSRELEARVRREGIAYYMIKPIPMNELKVIVQHLAKKHPDQGDRA